MHSYFTSQPTSPTKRLTRKCKSKLVSALPNTEPAWSFIRLHLAPTRKALHSFTFMLCGNRFKASYVTLAAICVLSLPYMVCHFFPHLSFDAVVLRLEAVPSDAHFIWPSDSSSWLQLNPRF